jgi:imidazolonepropionase-like amidohydrolase
VPTLTAAASVLDAAKNGAQLPYSVAAKAEAVIDAHNASFAAAVAAGVKIAMGTDSGVGPHGSNLRELALMAAGGMSPRDVLVAATSSAAELLGVDADSGTLTPGKLADIVIVAGGPIRPCPPQGQHPRGVLRRQAGTRTARRSGPAPAAEHLVAAHPTASGIQPAYRVEDEGS